MDTLSASGDFQAHTNTRSEATGEVLRLIFDEFWRLQREPVSERELADAKAYLTGSFPLTIETPDAIAMQVLNVVFYDLPIEDLQTFRERVNAVTTDDIQRVARAYLKPDRLSVVLVGNQPAFASDLRGVGFATYETVELGNLDLTAADFKRTAGRTVPTAQPRFRPVSYQYRAADSEPLSFQRKPPPPTITAEEGVRAKALLDRAIAAKGGLEKLRSIKRITATTKTSVTSPNGPVEAEAITHLEYPNHVRVETKLDNVTSVQVFDGEHAWVRDPKGVHDVPDSALPELRTSLRRDTIALLLAAERGAVTVRLLPDVKDATGTLYHALEFSGNDLDPVVLYIAPDTGLISKQSYVMGGAGQPVIEEVFGDYRPVDGVQIAYTATVRRGGQQILARHVDLIRINAPLDAALFKRPTP